MTAMVITWGDDRGGQVNITPKQEKRLRAASTWPRNDIGREYCQVSHGAHFGTPTFSDAEIAELIAANHPGH